MQFWLGGKAITNVVEHTARGAGAVQDNPTSGIQNGLMLRRMIQTLLLVGLNAVGAAALLETMLLIKLELPREPDAAFPGCTG